MKKLFKLLACIFAAIYAVNPIAAQETENWVVVDLETPGNLGVEILYQADKLSDVTHLRVSGQINDTDWATIKNLTNIQVIDMENAITTVVPGYEFDGRKSLISIKFPKTLKSIKEGAFKATSLYGLLEFPISLETIGFEAFQGTKIKEIKFAEGNKLKSLENDVFNHCDSLQTVTFSKEAEITNIPKGTFFWCSKLTSINIPESVTAIEERAFESTGFSYIDLPGNLTRIGYNAFRSTPLVSIIIPNHVNIIESEAFYNNWMLEEVELPASLHELYYNTFGIEYYNKSLLTKVICKSSTPPITNSSTFRDRDISQITLVVPDFAVPDYKLDSYWMKFGSIEGGAKSDYWDINGMLTLNNDHRFEGTPSVTIIPDGCLNILGTAPMQVDHFRMHYHNINYYDASIKLSQLINNSPLMSANSTSTTYYIYHSNRWYFISLPFDVNADDISFSDSSAEYVVRYYDGAERATANQTGNSWKNIPAGTLIKAGTGIIIQANKEGEFTFPCADDGKSTIFNPNSVTMELAAYPAESPAHSGWNFIANPYPCYYDMYYSMLSCPITIYNPSNKNYVAYSLIDDEVVLGPNRPFFIQASDDVKEIVFSNAGRQFGSEINRPSGAPAKSPEEAKRALFNIDLAYGEFTDAARVVINPDATEEYEINRDASKFFSDNASIPQLYSISSGEEYLAINERDEADGTVRLGYYAPEAGEMSLMMPRIDGEASLYDAETGETIAMSEGTPYHFSTSAGFNNGRFTLKIKANGTTGVKAISNEAAAKIAVEGSKICVTGVAGTEVTICSVDGKVFVKEIAGADLTEYTMPSGLYIVKVGAASSKCLIK